MSPLWSLSLKSLASPPLISTSKQTVKASPNTKFFTNLPKFSPKTIRCMRKSSNINLNIGSKPKPKTPNHEFPVSVMTTADKLRLLVSEFRSLTEPIDRVKRLLNYASVLPPLDESARVPANRVTGCTTLVWLEIKMDELGRMRFRADSDSEISKGFCSCLIWILDGAKPEEVMAVRSEDLTDLNVGVHGKTQSRVNTWQNVLLTMQKRTMALVVDDADVAHQEGDRDRPAHQHELLFRYKVDGRSYLESSKILDYSISMLPLYYDFSI